jgi:Fe-S cluster assembly ATP-binding protein
MLQIENLCLKLNDKTIIEDLNLHINKGEIHGILGENGTGKSTLACLLMGVNSYKPTSGRMLFEGEDIANLSVSQRAQKGMTLAWQEPARIEGLRVRDYLLLSNKNANIEAVKHHLLMVGMEPERYMDRDIDSTLSGGERKRIELASVFAMQPKLIILDEPDSGIDIVSLPSILDAIVAMNRQGTAVLLITHSEQTVDIAHRVSVLCAGKIIKTGVPAEMKGWFKENCRACVHINEPDNPVRK